MTLIEELKNTKHHQAVCKLYNSSSLRIDFICDMDIKSFYEIFIQHRQCFSTDSRKINKGDIFFALKGDKFNGNLYAADTIEKGASFAVVDDHALEGNAQHVYVPDVLKFMQQLATYHRQQFSIPVLAIAGSNGKTSTKELCNSVLSKAYKVHATKGNFNNLIGVPITLLQMPLDTEFAVIEIGTNTFGEIAALCKIVEPTCGVITNIGKEHLEGFGDLEGVIKEESELYQYLQQHDGLVFVNNDDAILRNMSKRLRSVFSYSIVESSENKGELIESYPAIKITVDELTINSQLVGSYNAENIMSAYAVSKYFGLSSDQIRSGIYAYKSENNRSQFIEKGKNRIILDAYNANPSSVESALKSFRSIEGQNKVVLLGDMLELGNSADAEHRDIMDLCLAIPHTKSYFVGAHFMRIKNDLDYFFNDVDELKAHLLANPITNSWILVKGSRGIGMEKVLEVL
jgi:UDP-N-acetylmuramoyl-tripeptide--D-alanyl-D-alanine ligase